VTRKDLSEGKRAAQLLHAMDHWALNHGPHLGTVIVYGVPKEQDLISAVPANGKCVLWHEPDLNNQLTAFATDQPMESLKLL